MFFVGSDFICNQTDLVWTNGDSSIKEFSVMILPDITWEDHEFFHIKLDFPWLGVIPDEHSFLSVQIYSSDSQGKNKTT